MHLLVTAGIKVLEWLFLIGLAGSSVIVVLTFLEDLETMLERDEPSELAKPEQAGE